MKFTISATYLLKNIQFLNGVVAINSALPILDNLLFNVSNNKLTITASDLDDTMTTTLDVDSGSNGKAAIPARLLLDTLKNLPEQPLNFAVQDSTIIQINAETGSYSIAYNDADEFPKPATIAKPSETILPAKILSKAISSTLFAVSNDDLRPIMCGVLFELSTEGLIFVATDAHKLVKYVRTDIAASQESKFIMPKKPLSVLKNILSTSDAQVKIEYNDYNALFSFDNYTLSCRLIEGKYPNYEAVIPKENPNKLQINRSQFLSSVNRVAILSNRATHQIQLKTSGNEIEISTEDTEYSNKAVEQLACEFQGEDIRIGFNARFLAEMLKNMCGEEVLLEMSLPSRAGVLSQVDSLDEGEVMTMLVMPVMLSK